MDANDYQKLAARTLIEKPDSEYSDWQVMMVWNAIGLAGEAGEVADHIKKGVFHQHGVDQGKLVKELGDVLWYVAALCTKIGVSMEEVMQLNIEKLKRRYPDGFNAADSMARVDDLRDVAHADEEDGVSICDACGGELQLVRPGKWQCNRCECVVEARKK